MARFTYQVSRKKIFIFSLTFSFSKLVELVGGGFVINGATPSSFKDYLENKGINQKTVDLFEHSYIC